MKVFQIIAKDMSERGKMIALLRKTLKSYLLENSVIVTISPENELVLHMVLDSTVTMRQEEIVRAMQRKVKLHVQESTKKVAVQKLPYSLPDKQVVYSSRFGTAYKTWDRYH